MIGGRVLASSSVGQLVEVGPTVGPVVYFHVGHHGPGTGAAGVGGDEWALCCEYADVASDVLAADGVRVHLDRRGLSYKGSGAPVVASSRDAILYVQCHLNSGLPDGAPDHGLVFYDRRTRRGRGDRLADEIASALARRPGGCRTTALATYRGDPAYPSPWYCIASIIPPAVLVEPGFLQRSQDVEGIGHAIAFGVLAGLSAWGVRQGP